MARARSTPRTARATPPELVRLHVMANGHATREELERFVDLVQPGWRDHLVDPEHAVRYLGRMIVASSLPRAGVARTPLSVDASAPRVFLAGDHVDCGEILADAAAESALRVSRAILASPPATDRRRVAA